MWLTTSVTNHFCQFLILFQLLGRLVPHIPAHNRFMIVFQVVTFKGDRRIRLLGDEVPRRLLLEQLITLPLSASHASD